MSLNGFPSGNNGAKVATTHGKATTQPEAPMARFPLSPSAHRIQIVGEIRPDPWNPAARAVASRRARTGEDGEWTPSSMEHDGGHGRHGRYG